MATLTKKTIIGHVIENNSNYSGSEVKRTLESLIDVIKASLLGKKDVALMGYGRLTPRLKDGGRPVRNPKTLETYIMDEVGTVTLNSKVKNEDRVNTSDLKDILSELTGNRALSEEVITSFIEVAKLTTNGEHRLEVRNFGVFQANWNEPRIGRNPKTSQAVSVEGQYRPHFKIGRVFRSEITEALTKAE